MGEARRRKLAAAGFVDRPDAIRRFADAVLRGTQQALMVTVGPVVGDLTAGHDVRHWKFHGRQLRRRWRVPDTRRTAARARRYRLRAAP